MDLTFKTEAGRFNYRVCGVMIHNNKLLAMKDERSPYFYLPGGRVNLHETAEAAVLREIKEELAVDAKIIRPLWFNQNFFTEEVSGEGFHEICLYFLIDISETNLISLGDSFELKDGHQTLMFEWLPFETLSETYLYPLFIKDKIYDLPQTLTILNEIKN